MHKEHCLAHYFLCCNLKDRKWHHGTWHGSRFLQLKWFQMCKTVAIVSCRNQDDRTWQTFPFNLTLAAEFITFGFIWGALYCSLQGKWLLLGSWNGDTFSWKPLSEWPHTFWSPSNNQTIHKTYTQDTILKKHYTIP